MGRWFLRRHEGFKPDPRKFKDQMGYHEFLVAAIAQNLRKKI